MKEPSEEKLIPDHEYDGIQELDNPLPGWWLATFYLTIVFSMFYVAHYLWGDGLTLKEEFHQAMNAVELKQQKGSGAPWPDEQKLTASIGNSDAIASGKAVYTKSCAGCHGNQGEGMVGPNLTDAFWINGQGTPKDIALVVKSGVPEKGMPAWGAILKDDEIYTAVAYISSLKGSNPPNAKAPQGNEVK